MNHPDLTAAALLACASFLSAQRAPDDLSPLVPIAPPFDRVPIHTQPDERDGPAWAAGPDYKVRLDDGMTFFPLLGEAFPDNLPLGWRTRAVLCGGEPLGVVATKPARHRDAWRYELRRPGLIERYDVRVDGVEQSFVLESRPVAKGDLVVVGDVTTPLRAATNDTGHRELAFVDAAGRRIVRYGAAFAFDAVGRRLPLETTCDGATLRIRVPAAFVAEAVFPLTIDPLTQRYTIPGVGAPANGTVSTPAIARDDATNRVIVSYARASAQNDYDLWVRRAADDFSSSGELIYSDLSATRSTRLSSPASVYGLRQIIAVEAVTGPVSVVRLYFHDPLSSQLNSGAIVVVPRPNAAWSDSHPSLGSARAGDFAYLAFRRDDGGLNTDASRIRGVLVDARNVSIGAIRDLRTNLASGYDAEAPCVTPESLGDGWAVAWAEKRTNTSGDDWDVFVQRADASGALGAEIAPTTFLPQSLDTVSPQIAGTGGRYLLAYLARPNNDAPHGLQGTELRTQRVDWAAGQGGSYVDGWVLAQSAMGTLHLGQTNRPIAFDTDTDSHWAVAWRDSARLWIARLGSRGRSAETMILDQDSANRSVYSPSLCFDDDGFGFQAAYASADAALFHPVYGRRFEYPASAAATAYGSACAGAISGLAPGARSLPFAGTERYTIRLSGGVANAPTWLLASSALGLTPIPGSPGCTLLLTTQLAPIDVAFGISSATGGRSTYLLLPEEAAGVDLYWQYAQLGGGAVWTSDGLRTRIR